MAGEFLQRLGIFLIVLASGLVLLGIGSLSWAFILFILGAVAGFIGLGIQFLEISDEFA